MKFAARLLLPVLVFLSAFTAFAQEAYYTVQVVALSDRNSALNLLSDLLADGFPAYLVGSKSQEGDLFRIRIGSFGNRAATVAYIDAMPEIAGGRAVPALAEGIPAGLVPAHTDLNMHVPVSAQPEVLLSTSERLLVRTELDSSADLPRYTFFAFDTLGDFVVDAYRVVPGAVGDWYVLRDMALWPENLVNDTPEIRETFKESLLALIEERLDVSHELLDNASFDANDATYIRVVERYHPSSQLAEVVALVWYEGEARQFSDDVIGEFFAEPDDAPRTLTELVPEQPRLESDKWIAEPEDGFVRLTVNESGVPGKSWRAATGTPLLFVLSGLLTLDSTGLYYYEFPER